LIRADLALCRRVPPAKWKALCVYDRRGIGPSATLIDHFTDGEPYDYVISANLHRRHLTSELKRELIEKVLKAKPEASNATVAKQVKANDKTVAKVRRKLESTSEIPKLNKTVGADGKSRPKIKKTKETKKSVTIDADYHEVPPVAVPGLTTDEIARAAKVLDQRHSVGAKDIALSDFTNRVLELARLTRSQQPVRFTKTAVSFGDLNKVGQFLIELANLKSRSAEVSTEQRRTEHAALDLLAAPPRAVSLSRS
jgi:hypothetical protein